MDTGSRVPDYGVVLLIKKSFEKRENKGKKILSMKILRERYARGEVDKKEFKERKTVLQNNQ